MQKQVVIIGGKGYLATGFPQTMPDARFHVFSHNDWRAHIGLMQTADCVICCAVAPEFSYRHMLPDEVIDVQIARVLAGCGVQFVFLSSRKVYDISKECRVHTEDEPLCAQPRDAYARNKIVTENELQRILGHDLTILRIPNIMGDPVSRPGYKVFMGWISENYLAHGELVVNQPPETVKDFITKDFFHKALAEVVRRRLTGIYNISSNCTMTLKELLGANVGEENLRFVPSDGEAEQFLLDDSKFRQATGIGLCRQEILDKARANHAVLEAMRKARACTPLSATCGTTTDTQKKHQESALIHVHIYYEDMWNELAECVDNVSIPHELFVTLSRENPELRQAISERYPKAHIHVVPNRGYDVAPFIDILNRVHLDNYAYVIKLHSKRDLSGLCYLNGLDVSGSKWRDALLGFIKTPHDFKEALSYMRRHRKVGAVARSLLIIKKHAEENEKFAADIDQFLQELGWQCSNYSFVAGTMFMMRAHLLKPLQNRWTTDDFEEPEPDSYQLAHRIERLLGCCVYGAGYIIHDWRLRTGERTLRLFTSIGHFFYHSKTTRSGRNLIKICKIPVWWAKASKASS